MVVIVGNDSLSIEHKEEIQVILHKVKHMLINSIHNNNNNNNNIMAYGTRRFSAAFTTALQ